MSSLPARADSLAARAPALPRARRPRVGPLPYALIFPAAALIVGIIYYPLFTGVYMSFTDANLMRFNRITFIGLGNYQALMRDDAFLSAIWGSVRWVTVTATLQTLSAMPVALFLNQPIRFRSFLRTSVLVPWVVPGAVTVFIWRLLFDANFGPLTHILPRLGLVEEGFVWLSEWWSSFTILELAATWAGLPFGAVVILAALQAIPPDLYEAAKVDGAGAWGRFLHVTFPQLLPTLLLLLLMRTIWLSHSVDLIYLMTNGGPGYSNYTIPVYSFLKLYAGLEIGYSAAIAVLVSIVLVVVSIVYVHYIERSREYLR